MSGEPFVVRQFEGSPWVPLREAVRLHEAVQSSSLTIAALRNEVATSVALVARIVEAAGGEIRVSHLLQVSDTPELLVTPDLFHPLSGVLIYRTRGER